MIEYEFHPLADLFPLLGEAELSELADDMLEHGQREPIWLYDGKILDGRNRYRACLLKGINPHVMVTRVADPAAFVASANLHRRHLSDSERGLIAARLATMKQGARTDLRPVGETSQAKAAELLKVSKRRVERSHTVIEKGVPDLVDAVKQGDVSTSAAAEFANAVPPLDQAKLIAEHGSPAAAVDATIKTKAGRGAKPSKKPKADVSAAADRAEPSISLPKFISQFTRTDGEVKAACDFNPEDPGDVAESESDTPEIIRHRIFMYRATEALRLAREFGFEQASSQEITDDVIDAVVKAAEAWSELAWKLRQEIAQGPPVRSKPPDHAEVPRRGTPP